MFTKVLKVVMAKPKSENTKLVIIEGNDLLVGTYDLAQGFNVEHRALTKRIKKYRSEFEEFNERLEALKVRQVQPKIGSPFDEFLLNEAQSTYLVTLLTNNDTVRKFKRHLTKEFFRQRKILNNLFIQKKNAEWHQKRIDGKEDRRIETDAIKEFIHYAKDQGSKNADKYYMAITKMENSSLFYLDLIEIEHKNLRDIVSGIGLSALQMADRLVAKALKDGMFQRMYYKDIFLLAKARVESFSDSLGKITVDQESELTKIDYSNEKR